MARYGMLETASNYRNKYKTDQCNVCLTLDDENHRLNDCPRWKNVNLCCHNHKINFDAKFILVKLYG